MIDDKEMDELEKKIEEKYFNQQGLNLNVIIASIALLVLVIISILVLKMGSGI